jgi:hypothetical protein
MKLIILSIKVELSLVWWKISVPLLFEDWGSRDILDTPGAAISECRKLRNEERNSLYLTSQIIVVVKSKSEGHIDQIKQVNRWKDNFKM